LGKIDATIFYFMSSFLGTSSNFCFPFMRFFMEHLNLNSCEFIFGEFTEHLNLNEVSSFLGTSWTI